MSALGRRLPYGFFLALFATANAWLMNVLNSGYDTVRAESGADAAISFAMVGLLVAGAGLLFMLVLLVLRLRNADRSGWWALLGLIPFLNFAVLFIAAFLPEEY